MRPACPRFQSSSIVSTNLKRKFGEHKLKNTMSNVSSSSSSQQNLRNFYHLLTIICCACRSLLQPPLLPVSHEKKVLDNFVRSIKRGNCPAFKRYNLLITGFTFVGFIDIKGIDLHTVWLLVEVIVPTVFDLYVFSTASFRSESIVVFYKFALGSEKDHNCHPLPSEVSLV